MYDFHIHSTFSQDSRQSIEEVCENAAKLGLKEIAITDHIDRELPTGEIWDVDYNLYMKELTNLSNKFKGQIGVVKGIELGVRPSIINILETFIKETQFDYVIASIHCVGNHAIREKEYFSGRSQKESYMTYFNELLNILKNYKDYSVVGHLDIIARYGEFVEKKINYCEYQDILDEILKVIIENNRGLEINTSGYRYGMKEAHPNIEIIKRYKELGGEILTVGSDAHRIEHIGYKVRETYEILKQIGYKYITTYKDLKPNFRKI